MASPKKPKKILVEALRSKDLFLWLKNERLQQKIEEKEWANHMISPKNSDFLAVNLANLGSKKADRYLIKKVFHHANIRNDIPEMNTEVVLRYPGSKNFYADDYKGYLRIYLPAAATITSDTLGASIEKEDGFQVISTQIILPAGGKTSVSYTYQLPRTHLPDDSYQLRFIKQSGDNKQLTVTVESNEDSEIISQDFVVRENKAIWQENLIGDTTLSLHFGEDNSPPYPIEQVFENLSTVSIYWNEPIENDSASDALNYTIVDTDHNNEEITDEVKVIYAEVIDGNVSKLELEGVSEQDLERYKITLKNIQDQSGNTIDPNPKEITAVQRPVGTNDT